MEVLVPCVSLIESRICSLGLTDETANHEPSVSGGNAPREDTEDDNAQPVFPDRGIEAHLAPSDADVEARTIERLEAENMREVEERMVQGLTLATVSIANHDNIVFADEVMESPTERPNKRPLASRHDGGVDASDCRWHCGWNRICPMERPSKADPT